MARKNGWVKARALVSAYLLKNQGQPGIKSARDLLMPARKFLAGYTGASCYTIVYFEEHLGQVVPKTNVTPENSDLDSVLLLRVSELVSRVGSKKLVEYIQVVESIRALK